MQTPDHGSRQRNRQHGEHHVQQRGNQLNPRNQGREKTAFRKEGTPATASHATPTLEKTSCSSPFPARPSKRHHALMTRIQYFFLLQPESAPPGSEPGSGRTEGSPSSSMTVMEGDKRGQRPPVSAGNLPDQSPVGQAAEVTGPQQKHQVNRAFGRTVNCLILVQIAHGDAYLDSFPWLKAEAGISCLGKPGPSHFKTSLEAVPEFPT